LANKEEKQINVDNNEEIKENIEVSTEEKAASEEPTVESLSAKVAELEKLLLEKEDRYLRMAAEYDNFRRRSREEREGVYNEAVADTVSAILPIIDNLERASMYSESDKVRDGLVMIAKSVDGVLENLKIETMGAVGETFDPNFHNAVMHSEDPELGENVITDVFQRGYKYGDRVIRYAMVKVAN
jgi:molecular chaperone GrpE